MNAVFSSLRSKLFLLLLIALVLRVGAVWAQTPDAQIPSSQARIAQDLEVIRIGEQQHLPPAKQAALWEQLALQYESATEFLKAEDAYLRALRLLKNAPSARAEYAFTLDNLSSFYMIYRRLDDAESTRKQAIKVRQKLGSPAETGQSEVHLADIALLRRQYKKAERLTLHGLQMMESSSNPPRAGVLSAFITLTFARCSRGHCGEGLMNAKQAVAFANKNFESESARQRVRPGVARVCRVEERGVTGWRENHAASSPDTTGNAVPYRSSPGRGHVAIPVLLNRGTPAGGSARD